MSDDEADYSQICTEIVLTRGAEWCEKAGFSDRDPDWVVKGCRDAQERALDEFQLEIDNIQELYYGYPSSPRNNFAVKSAKEIGHYQCDRTYQPSAEEEINEARKPTGDEAKDIANSLFRPFKEQYVEIPKPKRQRWAKQCNTAVDAAVRHYDVCVRKRFKKPE